MKIELDINFPTTKVDLPPGATRATQWFKMGDHPRVLQDYEAGLYGDVNLDLYFIIDDKDRTRFTYVEPGDWVIDMADGTVQVTKVNDNAPEEIVKKAFHKAFSLLK